MTHAQIGLAQAGEIQNKNKCQILSKDKKQKKMSESGVPF